MAFTGDEGSMIDPALAQKWIDNYQKGLGPNDTRAEFVGFRRLSELLSQDQAIGLRIYYGKDDAGQNKLILVAVSPGEQNLAPIDGSPVAGMVLEDLRICPPFCNVN
jgi:hypothetical protein